MREPLYIHIVHAEEDAHFLTGLDAHLQGLAPVSVWYEGKAPPGGDVQAERRASLERAGVVLLLVSADFLASRQCQAEAAHLAEHAGGLVIPVLFRPCRWEDQPFAGRAVLPANQTPLSTWENLDAGLHDVISGIERALGRRNGARVSSAPWSGAQSSHRPEPPWEPRPPRGLYSPTWYVNREREERQALNSITAPGQATVIWGPILYGKSWLAENVLSRLPAEAGAHVAVVRIDLAMFGASLASEEAFLQALGARIVKATRHDPGPSTATWRKGTARLQLEDLLRDVLEARQGNPLVFFIESLQQLVMQPYGDGVLDLFRSLLQQTDDPWPALRLVLAITSRPAQGPRRPSPFFNAAMVIRLGGFTLEQTEALARMYRLDWGEEAIAELRELVAGHPMLQSMMMHEAKLHGTRLSAFRMSTSEAGGALRHQIRSLLPDLDDRMRQEVKALLLDPAAPLSPETYITLRCAGFVAREGTTCRILGSVLREILAERSRKGGPWPTM